jgi:hypothetical protein
MPGGGDAAVDGQVKILADSLGAMNIIKDWNIGV